MKMTEEPSPTSREEFRAELHAVLRRAYENDVEIKGGFDCRNGDGSPDWDVIVTEVETDGQSA
jgi:hypothetical protein